MDFPDETLNKSLFLPKEGDSVTTATTTIETPTTSTAITSETLIPNIMETFAKSSHQGEEMELVGEGEVIFGCRSISGSFQDDSTDCSALVTPVAPASTFRSDFSSELSLDSGAVQMLEDLKQVSEPMSVVLSTAPSSIVDESTIGSKLGIPEDDSRSSFDSFKAPLAPPETLLALPLEEDSQSSIKASNTATPTPTVVPAEEDSQSSFTSQRSSKRRWEAVDFDDHSLHPFTAASLFEYQWPVNGGGDYFILQEQISEFLGVKSFKRKYPDLQRRQVEMDEKEFLKERGVVSETQCDLGLTALRSDEVIDLMVRDYFEKYQEYERVLHEKEKQSINEKHRGYTAPNVEKSKMAEFIKKSMRSAAEWNMQMNRERKEERNACFDLQSNIVHYPTGKGFKLDKEATKVGRYPVALVPGQFQDYYREFTQTELRYYPLNTVIYGPRPTGIVELGSDGSISDSDDTSSSDGSSSGSTRDGSGDSSTNENATLSQVTFPPSQLQNSIVTPMKQNAKERKSPGKNGRPRKKKMMVKVKSETNDVAKPVVDRCRVCHLGKERFKNGQPEEMIHCSLCRSCGHISCLQFSPDVVSVIRTYPWQCMDCKKCMLCLDPHDEAKMMFCEKCDRGYHTFCVGLKNLPRGPWVCVSCGKCAVCGVDMPGAEGSKAQWHHEYMKSSGGKKQLKRTLCLICARNASGNKSGIQSMIGTTPIKSSEDVAIIKVPHQPLRLQMRMKRPVK